MLKQGFVNPQLLSARTRRKMSSHLIRWPITQHWLMHIPAPPGTTFVLTLFPRRPSEPSPAIEYCEREETISIRHAEGRDLVFLRPNPMVAAHIQGVVLQGRAGILCERGHRTLAQPLDAISMRMADHPANTPEILR